MWFIAIKAAMGALFGALIGWWKPRKDPEVEGLEHEVQAQRSEAANLATPAPDWNAVTREL